MCWTRSGSTTTSRWVPGTHAPATRPPPLAFTPCQGHNMVAGQHRSSSTCQLACSAALPPRPATSSGAVGAVEPASCAAVGPTARPAALAAGRGLPAARGHAAGSAAHQLQALRGQGQCGQRHMLRRQAHDPGPAQVGLPRPVLPGPSLLAPAAADVGLLGPLGPALPCAVVPWATQPWRILEHVLGPVLGPSGCCWSGAGSSP